MMVVLNARLARRVAAVTKAAGTDEARPVLAAVQLEWTPKGTHAQPSVTFVATDSFRLIAYEVDAELTAEPAKPHYRIGAVGEVEAEGSTLVKAKPFARLLERAASHATVSDPDGLVVLEAHDSGPLLVYAKHSEKGEVEIGKVETVDGTFPKWRTLMPAPGRTSETSKVGLNPTFLAELLAAFGAGNLPQVGKMPVTIEVDEMRPILVRSNARADGWKALLMPVRV